MHVTSSSSLPFRPTRNTVSRARFSLLSLGAYAILLLLLLLPLLLLLTTYGMIAARNVGRSRTMVSTNSADTALPSTRTHPPFSPLLLSQCSSPPPTHAAVELWQTEWPQLTSPATSQAVHYQGRFSSQRPPRRSPQAHSTPRRSALY